MRESKVSQGLLIQNVERRIFLIKTVLSISLTKLNYPCLKLQQEACIRKLVLDCNLLCCQVLVIGYYLHDIGH